MRASFFSDKIFIAILDSVAQHVALIGPDGEIRLTNRSWDEFARRNGDPSLSRTGLGMNYLAVCRRAADADPAIVPILEGLEGVIERRTEGYECEYPCHSPKQRRWFLLQATRLRDTDDILVVSHTNITERKLAEEASEAMVGELQKALAEVRELRGLIPICAMCKRVRDDEGYWSQIEAYISEHTGAQFTQGLCPSCALQIHGEAASE